MRTILATTLLLIASPLIAIGAAALWSMAYLIGDYEPQ